MPENKTEDSKKSYGQILKTTAIFGSVKLFSVLVGLLRTKVIALFLGPAGMGIFNLINYPVTLVSQLSGMGISTSGIREVAQTNDEHQLREVAEVIKYWNRTLGVIGSLVLLAIAPWLSQISFGNDSFTWAFRILSVVVFLTALGSEYEVLLRGRRETKLVAKAGFFSSLAGFVASIPFYYFFGTTGIVVVILVAALTLAGVNYLYARKLNIQPMKLPFKDIFRKGKNMASIGFFVVLGDLIFVCVITAVNAYIRQNGGLEDVGYFQSCNQVTLSSINLVLVAMAADYYPRLSKLQGDAAKTSEVVTQQTEVAVLLCTPLIVSLIVFSPLVIKILLSSDFLCIQKAICLFFLGSIVKLPSWAMNFVVLANGKTKLYTYLILFQMMLLVPMYCFGFDIMGIEGIGLAYIILMSLYTVIQNLVIKRKFGVVYGTSFWKLMFVCLLFSLISYSILWEQCEIKRYAYGSLLIVVTLLFFSNLLNKKTEIFTRLKEKVLKR